MRRIRSRQNVENGLLDLAGRILHREGSAKVKANLDGDLLTRLVGGESARPDIGDADIFDPGPQHRSSSLGGVALAGELLADSPAKAGRVEGDGVEERVDPDGPREVGAQVRDVPRILGGGGCRLPRRFGDHGAFCTARFDILFGVQPDVADEAFRVLGIVEEEHRLVVFRARRVEQPYLQSLGVDGWEPGVDVAVASGHVLGGGDLSRRST